MNASNMKRIHTVNEKYGVDNVSQLRNIQDKRRYTFDQKRTMLQFDPPHIKHEISGDNLTLYRLNKQISDEWLNMYHPLKAPRGNLLCLGLVKDDTIYCLMTFKKCRDKRYNAELSRMWMLPDYYVTGGYSILSEYASKFGLYNIVAYVNLTFENYLEYESIGMTHVRNIQKTRWWIKDSNKITDASRRQQGILEDDLIKDGWLPVYDCGQAVYEFR